ncbi:DUF4367 domain-containing protein [Paenibacillus sp. YPG26]|uniref:DUF4367 domain-containing protein n=1 Tax=Paenibacillus sp. YPG26 TaxID=2878915 RepID=UPI0020422C33|nr:DUF4367 domain-containing protein [Paenibacillus sp. YPG26]USB31678.1 DUF4367 domain-containing protein [Paenibacillus sp. YPG26]
MFFKTLVLSFLLLVGSTSGNEITSIQPPTFVEKVKSDFRVITPSSSDFNFEIKEPSKLDPGKTVNLLRIHYFDKSGTYIFGITQHKAKGYKTKQEVTNIDIKSDKITTTTHEEDFTYNTKGDVVNVNGIEGRFEAWANNSKGGVLRWIQEGTYMEMDSADLSKQDMIKIAESMK